MTQGTNTIKAITIGNNTVQENDISWSKRILGKEALTQIKVNINIHDFTANIILYITFFNRGSLSKLNNW